MKPVIALAAFITCLCAVPAQAAHFLREPIVPNARIENGGLEPADTPAPATAKFEILTTPETDYAAAPGTSYILWQTVKNAGATPATIDLADVRNVTGGFALLEDQCSGVTLAPHATCQLGVKFAPRAIGSFSAEVEVIDAQNGTHQATLLANAVDGLRSLQFSVAGPQPVPVSYTGGPTDVLVTLTAGDEPAAISRVTDDSALYDGVTIAADYCSGHVLKPGQSCTVGVQLNGLAFTPDLSGYRVVLMVTSQVSAARVLGGFDFDVIAP
jgi:hypothetical protein